MIGPPKERRGLQAALITDSAREYAVFRVPATRTEISPHCVVCGFLFYPLVGVHRQGLSERVWLQRSNE